MPLTLPSERQFPRLLVLGSNCHYTIKVLERITQTGIPIAGIFLPGIPGSDIPLAVTQRKTSVPLAMPSATRPSATNVAIKHNIPTSRIGRAGSAATIRTIEKLEPDILLAVCYPRLIPKRVTSLFPGRALNVHTSLLPDLRGPDPLFWTLRRGDGRSGVTLHHLTSELDAGPIVARAGIEYEDGTTEAALETQLASVATGLLTQLLLDVVRGRAWPSTIQDETQVTWAPFPNDDDYRLDHRLTARSAYNFVRGIQARGNPVRVEHHGSTWVVREAVAYADDARSFRAEGDAHIVPFRSGYLLARLTPNPS
jgi:methionyl-tRNA formyltransferase